MRTARAFATSRE